MLCGMTKQTNKKATAKKKKKNSTEIEPSTLCGIVCDKGVFQSNGSRIHFNKYCWAIDYTFGKKICKQNPFHIPYTKTNSRQIKNNEILNRKKANMIWLEIMR